MKPAAPDKTFRVAWADFMAHWEIVQCDLMSVYGVRDDRARDYSWPWFNSLVFGLSANPKSMIYHVLREGLDQK